MENNDYLEVLKFYKTMNKLKTLQRTGWKLWGVKAERIESVAEHIFGTQMLAIALNSQFKLGLNIERVVFLLAIHEIGETMIGDITPYDNVSVEEKHNREMKAVSDVLGNLYSGDEIFEAFCEFENRLTKEGEFAHLCDKLEACLQCKFYDDMNVVDLFDSSVKNEAKEKLKNHYINMGITRWSDMWFKHDIEKYKFPDEYVKMLEFLQKNGFDNILINTDIKR